jgi:hypothetical protein
MKTLSLCVLLLAFVPASLFAAPRIAVEARFIQSKGFGAVPHDLDKLRLRRNAAMISLPRSTVKPGQEATLEITRTFRTWNAATNRATEFPTGVMLHVTPAKKGGRIAYGGKLTLREFTRISPHDREPEHSVEFNTNELYISGNAQSGQPVWFDLKNAARGYKLTVYLRFTEHDA